MFYFANVAYVNSACDICRFKIVMRIDRFNSVDFGSAVLWCFPWTVTIQVMQVIGLRLADRARPVSIVERPRTLKHM